VLPRQLPSQDAAGPAVVDSMLAVGWDLVSSSGTSLLWSILDAAPRSSRFTLQDHSQHSHGVMSMLACSLWIDTGGTMYHHMNSCIAAVVQMLCTAGLQEHHNLRMLSLLPLELP
jgi:hypothetical protein